MLSSPRWRGVGVGALLNDTADGAQPRLLLQTCSAKFMGPIPFETIQLKEDAGFGEAPFKSIERKQMERGALCAETA